MPIMLRTSTCTTIQFTCNKRVIILLRLVCLMLWCMPWCHCHAVCLGFAGIVNLVNKCYNFWDNEIKKGLKTITSRLKGIAVVVPWMKWSSKWKTCLG